ncbi:MAG: NUDIX domain-containing protein [Methylococcales bacterium]
MSDIQPPRPAIGVSAIIFDASERVLLIKRGQAPAFGQWHAPGGKLELGETMVAACQREVEEETGISRIEIDCLIAVVERRVEGFHYVIMDFLAHLTQSVVATPIAADDVSDARWVTQLELAELDVAEGLLPILQRARQIHQGELQGGLYDVTGMKSDFLPQMD